jgi:hypothetical protein
MAKSSAWRRKRRNISLMAGKSTPAASVKNKQRSCSAWRGIGGQEEMSKKA